MFQGIRAFQDFPGIDLNEKPSLEGFFDEIAKFIDQVKTKPKDPDSWTRRLTQSANGLIAYLSRTYADPQWVQNRGLVHAPALKAQDIAVFVMDHTQDLPTDIVDAVMRHGEVVERLFDHWEAEITAYTQELLQVLHKLPKGFDDLENEEKVRILYHAAESCQPLVIQNDVTNTQDLLGPYLLSATQFRRVSSRPHFSTVPPLDLDEIVGLAKLMIQMIRTSITRAFPIEHEVDFFRMYIKTYDVSVSAPEPGEDYDTDVSNPPEVTVTPETLESYIAAHVGVSYRCRHLYNLFHVGGQMQVFRNDWTLLNETYASLTRALERWMFRSIR